MVDAKESESESDIHEKQSRMARAWYWYKRMTMLPSSMGKYRSTGKVAYLLMSAVALYIVIIITLDDSAYTDVNELPDNRHILPDVVMCPYATSEHLRVQTTDITNTSIRDPYSRQYLVWYLRKSIEAFSEFSDGELDALAAYMRNKTEPDEDMNKTLNEKAQELHSLIQKPTEGAAPNEHLFMSVALFFEQGKPMDALWQFLALPPAVDRMNVKQLKCWPYLEGTVDYDWCKPIAEPIWIGHHLCVLFPFQTNKIESWNTEWNIKHYFFDWHPDRILIGLSEGLGVKIWMGNFLLQKVLIKNMWTMYPKEDDCFAYNDYEAFKISNTHSVRQTVCQDSIVFLSNSSFSACQPRPIHEYWMFKIGLNHKCSLAPWFFPKKVIHTTVRPTLNTVQRLQLIGGVFGFSTGFSVLQLLELVSSKIRRKRSLIRLGEVLFMALMTAFGGWLAIGNLQELVSTSRFVRSSEYQLLRTEPLVPHVALGRAEHQPMLLLNHSRLAEFNVSLPMLRYLTGHSGNTVHHSWFYANFFLKDPKNNKNRTIVKKLTKLTKYDDMVSATSSSNYTLGMFTSELDEQFAQLAFRMGFNDSVPPYKIYEQFRVDLCALIKYCLFEQHITVEACCQYARYETLFRHRWSDAITIRFPKDFKLAKPGVAHGLEVYFDTKVFADTNFEYLGPEHMEFVQQIQFSRVGIVFSEYRLMVFDGLDVEKQFFGRTDVQIGDFESPGKILNAGFVISRIKRLQKNQENKCRQAKSECRSLSYGNSGSIFLARALAEKTMCNCHICHSTAPNRIIENLWKETGCCNASEATRCFNQPMKCCWNGFECCFDEVMNKNQTCNVDGRLIQTLLYNVRGETQAKCSMEYEVADRRAAASGSVVAQRISDIDRKLFEKYKAECQDTICDRKLIKRHRVDVVINANPKTAQWFGVRVYIAMDTILTSNEEDRFSILEAGLQFMGGFGLLFGFSIMTVFEMVSAAFDWTRNKIASRKNTETLSTNKETFHSVCKKIIGDRTLRSIDVFSKDQDTTKLHPSTIPATTTTTTKLTESKNKVNNETELQNTGGTDQETPSGEARNDDEATAVTNDTDDEESVISHAHAVLCLIMGSLLTIYSVYLMIQLFTQENTEATNEVSFNGSLSPPSIALCTHTNYTEHLIVLTNQAQCEQPDAVQLSCAMFFTIRLQMTDVKTCLISDFTAHKRIYEAQKRRYTDFEIKFPKQTNGSNLTKLDLWFGYLPSVREGQLTPIEPWALSKSTDLKYKLLHSTLAAQCDSRVHVTRCDLCEDLKTNNTTKQQELCCMDEADKQIHDLLHNNTSSMSPCRHNFYTVEFEERNPQQQNSDWVHLKLIDYYGVIELRTLGERRGWSIVISNFGTIIDTFVGVTFLNVLCVGILAVTLLIVKASKYMSG